MKQKEKYHVYDWPKQKNIYGKLKKNANILG